MCTQQHGPGISESMTLDDLRTLFSEYAAVSNQLSSHVDYETCTKLAMVLSDFLEEKVCKLVEAAAGKPILYSYQSDCTSFLTWHTITGQLGGKKLQRKGKTLTELLLERGYFVVRSGIGSVQSCVLLSEPRIMSAGKTTFYMFAAACEFSSLLRTRGHRGICLNHCSFDRQALSSLARCLHQRVEALYVKELAGEGGADAQLMRLLDWFEATGCPLHDASNALSWSLRPFSNVQMLSDLFVVISSIRNAFSLICQKLPIFVVMHLRWDFQEKDPDEARRFWQTIGVPSDLLETVVEANPRWDGHQLLVSTAIQVMSDHIEHIQSILVSLYRFRIFSSTRWLSVGQSCRTLMAGLFVGLDRVVQMVRQDKTMTDYYAHGFSRLDAPMRKYICIAGVSSFLAESVIEQLLEDARVARHVDALSDLVLEEFNFIASLGANIYDRLVGVIVDPCYKGADLQHDVIHSVYTQRAFLEKRIFSQARSFPWSLASGIVPDNLQKLSQEVIGHIDSGCTAKIKELLDLGWNMASLVSGVELLLDVEWGPRAVEQGHGSCAVLHKFHPDIQQESMVSRSLLHQCRSMWTKAPELQKIANMEVLYERNAKKARGHRTGRHVFLSELMESATKHKEGTSLSQEEKEILMMQHSGLYDALPLSKQLHYDGVAVEENTSASLAADSHLAFLEAQLLLAKGRYEQEKKAMGTRANLSDHRFTQADMEVLLSMYTSDKYSLARVKDRTTKVHRAPEQPPQHVRDAFASVDIGGTAPRPTMTATWCRRLCMHRHQCIGVAIGASLAEGSEWFIFLFATQSPLEVWFVRAELCSTPIPVYDSLSPAERVGFGNTWQPYQLQVKDGSFLTDVNIPFEQDAEVLMLLGLKFIGGSFCSSWGPCLPLEVWEEQWALPDPSSTRKGNAQKPTVSTDVRQKFPWVVDCLKGQV